MRKSRFTEEQLQAMAQLHLRHQQFEQALPQLNQWIRSHGNEARLDIALNARCWAKATLKKSTVPSVDAL